jgi:hypothetical protein
MTIEALARGLLSAVVEAGTLQRQRQPRTEIILCVVVSCSRRVPNSHVARLLRGDSPLVVVHQAVVVTLLSRCGLAIIVELRRFSRP